MRLIDADALRQAILSTMPERSEVLLIVDNHPEGIVRCKDCKYYGKTMGSCAKLDGYDYMPDFYCACGERKDN